MIARFPLCALVLVSLSACGSDPDPSAACDQIVDAFAHAWERCRNVPYDQAKAEFGKAFSGCSPSTVDQSKVDQCSSDLSAADCNLIKNGASPASCKDVLSQ
jgi:hypothetical protein